MGGAIRPLLFPRPPRHEGNDSLEYCQNLVWLKTKHGGRTPSLYFEKPGSKFTLLYTHGNAEDLVSYLRNLPRMVRDCDASILAVEYPGYSISEAANPSEQLCYEAVEAAFMYLTSDLGMTAASVVPFGRSLGTGPAVHLAAMKKDIHGLVLQSPLESGARAVLNKTISYLGYPFDPFKSYRKIRRVQAMTCIMHGTADEVVPVTNGQALYETLKRRGKAAEPLWLEGIGHNNMPSAQIMLHVLKFLRELAKPQPIAPTNPADHLIPSRCP